MNIQYLISYVLHDVEGLKLGGLFVCLFVCLSVQGVYRDSIVSR